MILYIVDNFETKKVVTKVYKEEVKSIKVFLNKLAIKNLMCIKGYKQSVKMILDIKSNVPVYFNNNILIFKLKTYNNEDYYINYFSLVGLAYNDDAKTILVFNNTDYLILQVSIKSLKNQIKKCKIIIDYLKNLSKKTVA